jgi:RimJ/RimL family protein N-acetyltransferase
VPFHPKYPLRTDRLLLRSLDQTDGTALLAYHSNLEVHRYLPMEPMDAGTVSIRLSHGPWSRSTLEGEGEFLFLGVELISTGVLIGDVMLRWVSLKDECGEIGYAFHPDHGGHGYATEAAHAIFHLAFEGMRLHRMIARIDARNTASLELARRVGMRREAHLVQSNRNEGGWNDEVDFALLRSEWIPGRGLT